MTCALQFTLGRMPTGPAQGEGLLYDVPSGPPLAWAFPVRPLPPEWMPLPGHLGEVFGEPVAGQLGHVF
jgi:hypothetical protein